MLTTMLLALVICFDHSSQMSEDHAKLVSSLRSNSEKCVSGVFRLKGTFKLTSTVNPSGDVYDVIGFSAFDRVNALLRFDYQRQYRVSRVGLDGKNETKVDYIGGKYVNTNEYSLLYEIAGGETVSIDKSNIKPLSSIPLFDYRCLGMCLENDIHKNKQFEDVLSQIAKTPDSLKKDNSGNLVYRRKIGDGSHELSVWFAEKDGYCPIRMEFRRFGAFKGATSGDKDIISFSECSWIKVNGMMLPSFYRIQSATGVVEGKVVFNDILQMQFAWEAVNKPVDASLFKYDGLGLAKGRYNVVDKRLSKPVIIQMIGREAQVQDVPVIIPDAPRSWFTWSLITFAAIGLLLLTVGGIMARNRCFRTS